jgi:RNA polymerase sigma factor (sigma-70 family)
MHLAPAATDADLLSRYLRDGDEGAFAALVRAHERMVIGTAWRRTGDAELARDVAQQVFVTLARKAALLADRQSVAGWLHLAATHLATRTWQAEEARRNRHEQAALQPAERRDDEPWPALEEALASLGAAEREALVLHFFEDQSYAEMALALGMNEAAARKRVSRALDRLGAQLRRRGFRGSATSVLAGAAAIQAGLPGTVAAGAALSSAAAGGGSSLLLTLTTLMGHTAVKIAAVVTLAAAIPIAWQSHANSNLRDELTATRQRISAAPAIASVPPAPLDLVPLQTEVAALSGRLAEARRKNEDLNSKLTAEQRTLDRVQQEVLVKLGKTEDLARTFAAKLGEILPLMEEIEKKKIVDASTNEKFGNAMKMATELLPLLGQIQKMEEQPEQAARFTTIVLGEVMKLPPETRAQLETTLGEGYTQLKRDGLSLSQKPKENPEAWIQRRDAADTALANRVIALLPEDARHHPILKLTGNEPGILLPSEASMPGGFPGQDGVDEFLKASPKKPEVPKKP